MTFFRSVGMALFDLMAAEYICENAGVRGFGKHLNL